MKCVGNVLEICMTFDLCVMQDMDSEVALHLKRLARKDPTTKVIFSLICVFAFMFYNSRGCCFCKINFLRAALPSKQD